MPATPLETARILANHYGHVLEPANYVRGVGISGRLRLAVIDFESADPSTEIADLVAASITDSAFQKHSKSDGSVHSGFVWSSELSSSTNDDRYMANLIRYADLYLATCSEYLLLGIRDIAALLSMKVERRVSPLLRRLRNHEPAWPQGEP